MEAVKAPQIRDFKEITPELFKEYVQFVAEMRHNQRRWFRLRVVEALERSKQMEKELDKLNAELLELQPKLF